MILLVFYSLSKCFIYFVIFFLLDMKLFDIIKRTSPTLRLRIYNHLLKSIFSNTLHSYNRSKNVICGCHVLYFAKLLSFEKKFFDY